LLFGICGKATDWALAGVGRAAVSWQDIDPQAGKN